MQISIIGGGIIGLNIAYSLINKGHEIFLFEKEQFLGHHSSTRNSEVIHAGFAYPPESLKAKLCVEGNQLTYELLKKLNIPHKQCGKWVIAIGKEEDEALKLVEENAKVCNVRGFNMSTLDAFYKAEPDAQNVTSVAFVESSGVLDVSEYLRALEVEICKDTNANIIYPCEVTSIDTETSTLTTSRGPIQYDLLINSAGLWADDIYNFCSVKDANSTNYQIIPFKGEYYTWHKGQVKTMIYPIPARFMKSKDKDGTLVSSMGIHTHRNAAGELYIGPSQTELTPDQKDNYSIDIPASDFAQKLSRFIQDVKAEELEQAYAGNRPKLYKDNHPYGDFCMFRQDNIIHLLGMESPGLTAAPAIAKYVMNLI